MNQDTKEQLTNDYESGMPMYALVAKYALSRQHIWAIAKDAGCAPRKASIKAICPCCGIEFKTQRNNPHIYCGQKCYITHGLANPSSEYASTRRKGLTIRQKQRIARKNAGPLPKGYVVHHLDGDLNNADPWNLFVFYSHSLHLAFHHRLKRDKRCKPKAWEGYYAAIAPQ